MNKILCPSCFSVFSTVHQPGKRERCPYCAAEVHHSATLIELGEQAQLKGRTNREISAWATAKLKILSLWWAGCESPDDQDLKLLLDKLTRFSHEVTQLRQDLANAPEQAKPQMTD